MVVECAKCVGYVETRVPGVERPVKIRVGVHGVVDKILPCVDQECCKNVLEGRDNNMVDKFAKGPIQR